MASTKRGFLVGRFVDGRCQLASKTGYLQPGVGACHPLVAGMTEVDHEQICKAVSWMADNPGVMLVNLTADAAYTVSWL
jgi:hypothetical protein